MPEDLTSRLKRVHLFAKLSREDLKAVAALFKRVQFPVGTELCRQGRIGYTAYLVESGELCISQIDPQGAEQDFGRLGPGDFFGETSLLLSEPRDTTIEVTQDATLWYTIKDDFDQLLDERPSILRALQMRPEIARRRGARRFKWQDADEIVIVCLHKHNEVLIQHLFIPALAILVGLFGCGYGFINHATWALIVGGLLVVVPLPFALYLYVDQQNDHYIVTNKRVVHEERFPLIREQRAEAPLRAIQDIQQVQQGWSARLFGMGDLIIETAAAQGHVVFRQIHNPAEVRSIIFEQVQRILAGVRAEERAAIRSAMRQQFGQQPVEVPLPPRPVRPQRKRLKLGLPAWLRAPLRIFTFFLPPLRFEQGDTITWRKHWVILLKTTALPMLFIALTTAATVFLVYRDRPDRPVILIGYGVAMVFFLPWWLWEFVDWQNDIYQVTATRIIDVERLPFYLREDRREASLDRIQNISLDVPSFWGKLLRYGSVKIETSGVGVFTFDYVPSPFDVQKELFRRMEAFQKRQQQQEAQRHQTELLDWFAVYDQLRHPPAPPQPPSSLQQEP